MDGDARKVEVVGTVGISGGGNLTREGLIG